jgi:CRP-like cAMP-binding protein
MLVTEEILDKYNLTPSDLEITKSCYVPHVVKANQYFLKEGEISNELGFVTRGLLRSYIYDDMANEITQEFFSEGTLIISFESFNNRVPSKESIKAIEDSELMTISYEVQNQLYEKLPVWKQICKDFSDMKSQEQIERTRQFQILSATNRYRQFCENNSQILQRATLGHIASYLGIDNATLSRIRKKS